MGLFLFVFSSFSGDSSVIQFETEVVPEKYTESELNRILRVFEKETILMGHNKVVKEFKINKINSILNIEVELNEMIETLRIEKIKPLKQ